MHFRMNGWELFLGERLKMILEAISQSQIDHIVIVIPAQPGVFGAVEKHASGGNYPIVADLVFRKYLTG